MSMPIKKHEGMFILWELFLLSTETRVLPLTHVG